MNFHDFEYETLDGQKKSLEDFKGQLLLVVNTASNCGYTSQYAGLEKLYQQYKERGFSVIAFPSNDFGAQEPGSAQEIRSFVDKNFKVSFPIFEKVRVKGEDKTALYAFLTKSAPEEILWNFTKFLIGPDGKVLRRFEPSITPTDEDLIKEIETGLPK